MRVSKEARERCLRIVETSDGETPRTTDRLERSIFAAAAMLLDLAEEAHQRDDQQGVAGRFVDAVRGGDPAKAWVIDGCKSGVVHGTSMLWGTRKTACGNPPAQGAALRLADPSEITCRAKGCGAMAGS